MQGNTATPDELATQNLDGAHAGAAINKAEMRRVFLQNPSSRGVKPTCSGSRKG
jgi:hypothetical protein